MYLKFKFVQGQDRGHLKADKATVLFTIRHTGYIYTYTGISISNLIRTNVKVLYSTPPPAPCIKSIRVLRRAEVSRAKLYYLRTRTGKATRLKEKFTPLPEAWSVQEK